MARGSSLLLLGGVVSCGYIVAGCSGAGASDGTTVGWSDVNDFLYQLQNLDLDAAGDAAFDLVITDYSRDGSHEERYSWAEIARLQQSPGGPKLVLAYLSIGEAEDYRWYWRPEWDADRDGTPDAAAPSWLGEMNPEWGGNYKVRYWDSAWQQTVFDYLDRIIEAGFSGVYLDIIDAYEYWGPGGDSGLDRATAERDMVDFVKAIARHARQTRGQSSFGVFPQNGDGLAVHDDYVATVTGIGREDLWYNGDTPQPADITQAGIATLDRFREAGKLVLVTDYVTRPATIADFYANARAKGYIPYATTRDLDVLTINTGYEPD